MESSRLETLPEPLCVLHHADVVYRQIRSICGCAVKRNPDQPRVSRPEEVINRPARCRIYRGSCGDEPHRMSIEPLDERVLLMEDVWIPAGELIRRCLIASDTRRPDDGRYFQIDRKRRTRCDVSLRPSSARAQKTNCKPQQSL